MKNLKAILAMVSLPIAAMSASSAQIPQRGKQPIYTITINVVDRTTKAINIPDLAAIRGRGPGFGNGRGRGNRTGVENWDRQISSVQIQAQRRYRQN